MISTHLVTVIQTLTPIPTWEMSMIQPLQLLMLVLHQRFWLVHTIGNALKLKLTKSHLLDYSYKMKILVNEILLS